MWGRVGGRARGGGCGKGSGGERTEGVGWLRRYVMAGHPAPSPSLHVEKLTGVIF